MGFPPLSNWVSVVLFACCFIGTPVVLLIGWLISGMMNNRHQESRDAQNNALRKRGVIASAVVISARKGVARSLSGQKEVLVDYEVDVQPENGIKFRQSFKHWREDRGYTAIAGQLVSEQGRKIWVTYDPSNPSDMIFEHYDEKHEDIVK
jgi:hypothetical protein